MIRKRFEIGQVLRTKNRILIGDARIIEKRKSKLKQGEMWYTIETLLANNRKELSTDDILNLFTIEKAPTEK